MTTKVSVIVPVYNVEQYLPDCIESLKRQSYDNLEIILIDDGSPDRCGAICDEYAKNSTNIYVLHQKNQGVSAARNRGLKIATGDYISFVDPDDMVAPDTYSTMISIMEKEDADIGRFDQVFFSILDDIKINDWEKETRDYTLYQGKDRVNHIINKSRSACLGIYKKCIVEELLFPEQYSIGEDTFFLCSALLKSKRVAVINATFYWRRINMSSATRSPYNSSWLRVLQANQDIENMLLKDNKEYTAIASCIFYRQSACLIFSMKNSYEKYSSDITNVIVPELRKRWLRFVTTPYLTIKEKLGVSLYCISWRGFFLIHKLYKKCHERTIL